MMLQRLGGGDAVVHPDMHLGDVLEQLEDDRHQCEQRAGGEEGEAAAIARPKALPEGHGSSPWCVNVRMSPGWQSSTVQIASSVEKRIALALPVLRMERLARVMSTRSLSSIVAHRRAPFEHLRQDERDQHREPAGEARLPVGIVDVQHIGRHAREAIAKVGELDHQQHPPDRPHPRGIGAREGIVLLDRAQDRPQRLEQPLDRHADGDADQHRQL
ncbi:hypothetical protein WR25_20366 [Diploscapter pachys]|uniref:Uncharacterized protein n=1 Tax=Diploscapter pachys TaxID=2018661 RepID=A0A2A2K058_9BILA|nr:hypothetical protein WR25_20366 [Diploscapter pachys]